MDKENIPKMWRDEIKNLKREKTILAKECLRLQDENKKQQKIIDKANKFLTEYIKEWNSKDEVINDLKLLQDILNEVE